MDAGPPVLLLRGYPTVIQVARMADVVRPASVFDGFVSILSGFVHRDGAFPLVGQRSVAYRQNL